MKTYNLPFNKVFNPINYKQVTKLTSYENLKACPSASQIMKRLSEEMFEEILEDLESGNQVRIEG